MRVAWTGHWLQFVECFVLERARAMLLLIRDKCFVKMRKINNMLREVLLFVGSGMVTDGSLVLRICCLMPIGTNKS